MAEPTARANFTCCGLIEYSGMLDVRTSPVKTLSIISVRFNSDPPDAALYPEEQAVYSRPRGMYPGQG